MLKLSDNAFGLWQDLRTGPDFGITEYYPGAYAFGGLARVWLSNAASLCRETRGGSDARVFGALYSIRHGLELWLKGEVHAQRVSAAWAELRDPQGGDFLAVATAAKLTTNGQRLSLHRALCALRNIAQDDIHAPECYQRKKEERWLAKAIEFIRHDENADRRLFATIWAPTFVDHKIMPLWWEAKNGLDYRHSDACVYASEADGSQPASMERIEAACELFDAFDPEGDRLRYPSSLAGVWHSEKLAISLSKLERLADDLHAAVYAFDHQNG